MQARALGPKKQDHSIRLFDKITEPGLCHTSRALDANAAVRLFTCLWPCALSSTRHTVYCLLLAKRTGVSCETRKKTHAVVRETVWSLMVYRPSCSLSASRAGPPYNAWASCLTQTFLASAGASSPPKNLEPGPEPPNRQVARNPCKQRAMGWNAYLSCCRRNTGVRMLNTAEGKLMI